MHHGDSKHLEKSLLQLVVYKHMDKHTEYLEDLFHTEICSVYKCQHVDLFLLRDLWDTFEDMFKKEIKKLDEEKFYLVTLSLTNGKKKFLWAKAVEVTDKMLKKNPLLGLH